jgi:hypothetical protein
VPAQYTVYRENGDVESSVSLPFHFVGEGAHLAVEVQTGSNSALEIPLSEIFEKLLEVTQ